jgi:hypothetical protein
MEFCLQLMRYAQNHEEHVCEMYLLQCPTPVQLRLILGSVPDKT